MSRPPRALVLLLCVVAVFGTAWAFVTGPWQSPDEISHFSYVQTIVENGKLPHGDDPPFSSELQQAIEYTNSQPTIFNPYAHPEWSESAERRWMQEQPRFSADDAGGAMPAADYPPLYYAYEAIFYAAARDADALTRLTVMRLGSALWLLVIALGAWLLAGELFGGRRLPQLVAGATAGLWPMIDFITASVNPDAMLYALSTLALWRGVVILKRGLTARDALLFGLLVGLSTITKISALVLVPPALALLAWAAFRGRSSRALLAAVLGAAALALPTVAWTGYTIATDRAAYAQASEINRADDEANPQIREFASYLWQFYLPRLPFMNEVRHHIPVVSDRPLVNTWIGMSWGTYGWVSRWFNSWAYTLFALVTAAVGLLALAGAVARRRDVQWAPLLWLGSVALITLAAVHWTDYSFYVGKKGLFAQGRYLFPLVGIAAATVAFALTWLPGRARTIAAGIWLGGLIVLQFATFGFLQGGWYAS